ncbi:MAG: hypothetical protein AAGG44_15095, partial [Planctomycetota bacterium]
MSYRVLLLFSFFCIGPSSLIASDLQQLRLALICDPVIVEESHFPAKFQREFLERPIRLGSPNKISARQPDLLFVPMMNNRLQ